MKIYSGASCINLAQKTALLSDIKLGDIELSLFQNNESRVYIKDGGDQNAVVMQSFSNPVDHHVIEFCLIVDALKRLGTNEITAIIPWFGYSKQDRVFRDGEPLSVKVIAEIIQRSPIKKIITFDIHNPAIMGFFDIPLVNIGTVNLFVEYFRKTVDIEKTVVISPDAGAVKKSTQLASELNVPVAYINKKRDLNSGEVSIVDIDRDVSGKHAIIIDDMIVTGSTVISVARFLKSKGVQSVSIGATHHLYLDGVQEKLDESDIDRMCVTNSIEKPKQLNSSKLAVISLENLLVSVLTPVIE